MKRVFFMLCALFCCDFLIAESDAAYTARVSSRIMELEMEDDCFSLWFTDSDTGKPIKDAIVAIKDVGTTKTDKDGLALFPIIDDGEYEFIIKHDDYVITKDTFEVMVGTIFFNKFSIPQKVSYKNIKVILDWGENPKDLDAHLVKKGSYHISYRDKIRSDDGTVWLDRDDTDSWGPETITITELDNTAEYQFYIFNYSKQSEPKGTSLSSSRARVRVYVDNRYYATYSIRENQRGIYWYVFNIKNGQIISSNYVE